MANVYWFRKDVGIRVQFFKTIYGTND